MPACQGEADGDAVDGGDDAIVRGKDVGGASISAVAMGMCRAHIGFFIGLGAHKDAATSVPFAPETEEVSAGLGVVGQCGSIARFGRILWGDFAGAMSSDR